ncbi:uncharacterized protein Dvar_54630 [Desulfosarcina variabilis str. Montpellier]
MGFPFHRNLIFFRVDLSLVIRSTSFFNGYKVSTFRVVKYGLQNLYIYLSDPEYLIFFLQPIHCPTT